MKRSLIRRFFGGIWWLLQMVGRALAWLAVGVTGLIVLLLKTQWRFVKQYVSFVNEFTGNGTLGLDGSAKQTHAIIRYPVRAILWMFSPFVILLLPTGLMAVVIASFIAVDQVTYPEFPVSEKFTTIDSTPNNGMPVGVNDIGNALLGASYHQMEAELSTPYLVGWTSNDMFGLQYFDNRLNRQLGVRHGAIVLLGDLADITKLGSIDKEDPRIVNARQSGFAIDPELWVFPASEDSYWGGIELIKSYQSDVGTGKPGVIINITNEDIISIFKTIDQILEVPQGRLIESNDITPLNEIDDHIFFAQGAAIVARDALVVMKSAYQAEIVKRGALEQIDEAIGALNKVLTFHPWVVLPGEEDSMFADHRAKLARYYSEARKRINNVEKAFAG
jgi:hypothetical protein